MLFREQSAKVNKNLDQEGGPKWELNERKNYKARLN